MIICIAGKNNIAVEILSYLLDQQVLKDNIWVLPCDTDDGKDGWQRSLLKYAKKNNLQIKNLEDLYTTKNLLFISLEYNKLVDTNRFKSKKLYNLHFSLLPKYRGMFTSTIPILNNEKYSGVTFHKIDHGIDTGDIVAQRKFKIDLMDNSRDLYLKYILNGIFLVKKCLGKILKKEIMETRPQKNRNSSYFSKKSINFKKIYIDLNKTAESIHNQIRAYNFREYQLPKVFDKKIFSSSILNTSSNKKPGSILFENDILFKVSTVNKDMYLFKDKSKELLMLCKTQSHKLIKKLLKIPKIVNVQNKKGYTPLIVAINYNQKKVVKLLLNYAADLSICDFNGKSSLIHCKNSYSKYKDPSIIKIILSSNLDVYQKDYKNKNVFDYAGKKDEIEALNLIKVNYK